MDRARVPARRVSPIIVAIRDLNDVPLAMTSPHKTVFLLHGSLMSLPSVVETIRRSGRDVFVHVDLVEGLGKDMAGLRWLSETVRPTGILTTKAPVVGQAKSLGLVAIQRMFLLDSQSIHTGMHMVKEVKPDFLEVMPGIIPEVIRELVPKVPCPIIAGGLCTGVAHYRAARAVGAVAISTSDHGLWQYKDTAEVNRALAK